MGHCSLLVPVCAGGSKTKWNGKTNFPACVVRYDGCIFSSLELDALSGDAPLLYNKLGLNSVHS